MLSVCGGFRNCSHPVVPQGFFVPFAGIVVYACVVLPMFYLSLLSWFSFCVVVFCVGLCWYVDFFVVRFLLLSVGVVLFLGDMFFWSAVIFAVLFFGLCFVDQHE